MNLTEFLLARIADREAMAEQAKVAESTWDLGDDGVCDEQGGHVGLSPARVLAECAAKRRIVSLFTPKVIDDMRAATGEYDETAFRGDQAFECWDEFGEPARTPVTPPHPHRSPCWARLGVPWNATMPPPPDGDGGFVLLRFRRG